MYLCVYIFKYTVVYIVVQKDLLQHLFLFGVIIICFSSSCAFWSWVRWEGHAASDPGVKLQPRLRPRLPLPPLLLQSHVPDAVPGSAWAMPGHTDRMINSTAPEYLQFFFSFFLNTETSTSPFSFSFHTSSSVTRSSVHLAFFFILPSTFRFIWRANETCLPL